MINAVRLISSLVCSMVILTLAATSCSFVETFPAGDGNLLANTLLNLNVKAGDVSTFISHYDIFIFEDDLQGRLDACQRVQPTDIHRIFAHSTSGRKRIVVIANADAAIFDGNGILTLDGLRNTVTDIRNDSPLCPVMSGEAVTYASESGSSCDIELLPLLSRITLEKIRVDFSSTQYSTAKLENIRIYLTNVNALHAICPLKEYTAAEIMNRGRFSASDTASLSYPKMFSSWDPDRSVLYCYPCLKGEYGPGQCNTRLVIEGQILGTTYYYPIDIGTDEVERGADYRLNVTITRTGCTDPDTAAIAGSIEVETKISGWREYDETLDY